MKGVDALIRASSASGRRIPRNVRHLKVVRISSAELSRRKRMLRITVAIGAIFFVASLVVRVEHVAPIRQDAALPPAQLSPIESQIVSLINTVRTRAGAAPLALSDRLMVAARAHSEDMADHGYLAHDSAAGDTPADRIRAAGLDYEEIAENLMSDAGRDLETLPQRVLATWLASPGPRNNLLSPGFTAAAVAIAHAADGSCYVTLDLMR